jgi:preprotein translocase subunit YajC
MMETLPDNFDFDKAKRELETIDGATLNKSDKTKLEQSTQRALTALKGIKEGKDIVAQSGQVQEFEKDWKSIAGIRRLPAPSPTTSDKKKLYVQVTMRVVEDLFSKKIGRMSDLRQEAKKKEESSKKELQDAERIHNEKVQNSQKSHQERIKNIEREQDDNLLDDDDEKNRKRDASEAQRRKEEADSRALVDEKKAEAGKIAFVVRSQDKLKTQYEEMIENIKKGKITIGGLNADSEDLAKKYNVLCKKLNKDTGESKVKLQPINGQELGKTKKNLETIKLFTDRV